MVTVVKRAKLIAPPLVRVKEEPTEFDDYDETTSLERRDHINGIDTSTNNAGNTPASPKVVDKDHRICYVCKVAKSLDCFSKNQKRKGEHAKCMDCLGNREQFEKLEARKQEEKEKRRLQLEEKREAERKLAEKNKAMEDLEERICDNCNIVKKKEDFDINERKKGEASVCISCNEEDEARIREDDRMWIEEMEKKYDEAIKVEAKENAEKEASMIQKVKAAHEQYVTKLEASGSTMEKEMTKQADLLYIVTSISKRGLAFGPCLHGVYTTCQKAQEAARKTFERLSESYRDGDFVSHKNRVAKCDMTNFLIPGVEGAFRSLFEVLGAPEYEDDQIYTAIAINAARLGNDIQQSIPFTEDTSYAWIKAGYNDLSEDVSAGSTNNDSNSKIHAIFSLENWDEDVDLLGIYKDREAAMNRARVHAKDFMDEEQINDSYNYEVTNGWLFVNDGGSVSIETVTLDEELGGFMLRVMQIPRSDPTTKTLSIKLEGMSFRSS